MKKIDKNRIEVIIVKHLSGNISEDEKIYVENWLKSDPENAVVYKKYKSTWDLSQKLVTRKRYNWERINAKISSSNQLPGYITTGNKIKNLNLFANWQKIAAAILVFVLIGATLKLFFLKSEKIGLISVNTINSTILPDGSNVDLNTGSVLHYPSNFNHKNREVTLTGEAFFKITPDKEKPFMIKCSNTTVKVVGTEFNVKTDSIRKEVVLSVVEGVVEFFPSGSYNEKIVLLKDEEGRINYLTGEMNKSKIQDRNFLAWKTGKLIFDETPMPDALSSIQNFYNTIIVVRDTTIHSVTVTTTFINQDLVQVLDELQMLAGINYTLKNDTIYLE